MEKEMGQKLILDFIRKLNNKSTGLEPYPISVRGINWIKFLSRHNSGNPEIDNSLFAQYVILLNNLEYKLLGNHLLENGFSLLFGGFYFNELRFYVRARNLVEIQLNEQILDDGGHFELSPMYHQIILDRILDCINLLQNNKRFDGQESLLTLMKEKSVKMLQWLNRMTFSSGSIPLFNDSAFGIAPVPSQLIDYAKRLELIFDFSGSPDLKDSGYRRFNGSDYECIIDIGQTGPDYQPGHAHADTFTFEIHHHGKPLIVDTGISTYEKNERRHLERSTAAHNTVQVDGKDSSEVWGGFRVARRSFVKDLKEESDGIQAIHDGYKCLGIIHKRKYSWHKNKIEIVDQLLGKNQKNLITRFHFHPDVHLELKDNKVLFCCGSLTFIGAISILLSEFQYSPEFNKQFQGIVVEITFTNELISSFDLN